ncbi:MAG: LytTR family DNA-binding domain-containing protein [Ignavibacteriaceae bacterium]|jgi:two-component system LytT family response regulator|nr:LytTR family DNA-binding domain-containing protein [Ignavibacteriaceae bacterium]
MKVLIVDDEQPARKKIISFLNSETGIEQISEAGNGLEAIDKIRDEKPDLVFLDIQMPGKDGFGVIAEIGSENMPPVVFVTAYDQYAIDAFDVNAVDYLLKPFDQERFKVSFNRVLDEIKIKRNKSDELRLILNEIKKEKKYLDRILINVGAKYFFVALKEILYISSAEKYAELHTIKGKYLLRETMTNLEESLDPEMFARIHRSYIVNIEQIQEMQPWSHGDYVVILKNGEKLQMSRRYKDRLMT